MSQENHQWRIGENPPDSISEAKKQRNWKWIIQHALHREIPEKTEARYYTPFFIRSKDSHRDLWLIHLSGHLKAIDVMLGLHWSEGTSFSHFGGSGLNMLGYDQRLDEQLNKQLFLPGFYFDQTAKEASQAALLEQLPERLSQFRDGMPFQDLFAHITNESPVTASILKEVVSELAHDGVIQIRDQTGLTKRRGSIQSNSDVIIPSQQQIFRFD